MKALCKFSYGCLREREGGVKLAGNPIALRVLVNSSSRRLSSECHGILHLYNADYSCFTKIVT